MRTTPCIRKHLTPAQRNQVLGAYRRSQLPQRQFAKQVGIGVSTLQLWLRKAAAEDQPAPSAGFIEVPNLLSPVAKGASYRVHLAGGIEVEVASGFRPEEVVSLLRALREV